MNPRWSAVCALLLLPAAGCAAQNDDTESSAVSFSAVAGIASASASVSAPAGTVELAASGTVCGSVATGQDDAQVVIRTGSANCVRVLRAARAYAAAAAHADGQPVTVETGGWRCSPTAETPAVCRAGDASFSVG